MYDAYTVNTVNIVNALLITERNFYSVIWLNIMFAHTIYVYTYSFCSACFGQIPLFTKLGYNMQRMLTSFVHVWDYVRVRYMYGMVQHCIYCTMNDVLARIVSSFLPISLCQLAGFFFSGTGWITRKVGKRAI